MDHFIFVKKSLATNQNAINQDAINVDFWEKT